MAMMKGVSLRAEGVAMMKGVSLRAEGVAMVKKGCHCEPKA